MKKEAIIAICIEEIRNGSSTIEDCVTRYPEIGQELRSLLEVAVRLKPGEAAPSLEFKQRARRHLFEEMQPALNKKSFRLWGWSKPAYAGRLAAVLIGMMVLGVAGGGTIYAAQSSLPGDILYPVKTGVENLQLAVTPGLEAKANVRLQLAQRRINEAVQQTQLSHDVDVQALQTVGQQFDRAIKELSYSKDTETTNAFLSRLSEVTLNQQLELERTLENAPQDSRPVLKETLQIAQRGNLIAQVAYVNNEFLKRQPSVTDQKLEASQFKVEGTLLSVQSRTWNVGGVIIDNVYCSQETPAIGSRVKLEGLAKGSDIFISQIEVSGNSPEPTKVEGQFDGTNRNGTTNIGAISVNIGNTGNNAKTELQPGDKVQLQGGDDNEMNVTSTERPVPETENDTNLRGELISVNESGGWIMLKMTGTQVKVNISQARLETGNGKTLRLVDLNRYIGRDIKLGGLSKTKDSFSATIVEVNAGDH